MASEVGCVWRIIQAQARRASTGNGRQGCPRLGVPVCPASWGPDTRVLRTVPLQATLWPSRDLEAASTQAVLWAPLDPYGASRLPAGGWGGPGGHRWVPDARERGESARTGARRAAPEAPGAGGHGASEEGPGGRPASLGPVHLIPENLEATEDERQQCPPNVSFCK